MKILQIRGRNLASLAGDFDLDFEQGPLADAGLFAIAGPTGAGKSTLLDALSLALYDRTPRLESNSGYQIPDGPDESLGVHDTRNLLRRGTADGLAEVRFIGTDGRRYRASWSVRRARLRLGGKLQPSDVQLLDDATQQPLGRTKTEVLAATERAVGLSFDQFRRSMLLAQGDFAAFLKARSDERSELLERMTGTALYSAVSMRAHAKAREIGESLRLQEEAAKALPILEADARAALEARVAELTQTVARTAAQLDALRQQQAWWARVAELQQKLGQAQQRLAAAHQRWDEAAPRRAALVEIEQAQPLRGVDQEAARTAEALAAAAAQLTGASSAWAQARSDDERAAEVLARASADQALRQAEAETARPQIDLARSLDQSIADKTAAVEATDRKLALATQALAALEATGQALASQHAAASATLETVSRWLEAQAAVVVLAPGWREGVAPQLQAFEKAHALWQAQRQAWPALQQAHEQAAAAHRQRQHDLAAAEAAVVVAQEQVRVAEAAEAAHPAGSLAERRTALEAARGQFTQLQQQHELATQAEQAWQRCQAESARAGQEQADAATQAGQAAAARRELAPQLAGTERLLAQLGLSAHRAQLVDGEPCPLCGALHHPGVGPVDTTVAALGELRQQQTDRLAALQQQEATAHAQAAARAARVQELAAESQRRQAEQAAAATRWASLGGAGPVLGTEPQAWLAARALALKAEAQALAGQDQAGLQLRQAAAGARQARDDAAGAAAQARSVAKAAEGLAAAAAAQRDGATAEQAALRQVLEVTLGNLAPAFQAVAGWQAELEADPKAFIADWATRTKQARLNLQAREASRLQLGDIASQREVQASALRQSLLQRDALTTERQQQARQRDALRAQRQVVLQGRPAAEAEAALQSALKSAGQALEAAAAQARQTREVAAARAEAHRLAAEAAGRAAQDRQQAAEALAQALVTAGLDADTLRTRLAHPASWVDEERRALGEIDRLRSIENQAVQERQNDLAAHTALPAPPQTQAEIDTSLAALAPQHGEQSQQLGAAKQQRDQDDRHRAAGEAHARALDQARRDALVWQQLDTLIGSADGKKFRKFAQSLTLELLLAQANAELASLAPRYALQRVKAQDLEIQVVDRDMGDEVRSTASLSGGETFLVSLALALGLSSLASEKVKIESLFVDEGFGSLDPQTLELALSTLDALQSAGRKVGLISHVPGLAERIGVQVLVERQGQGASTVRVVSPN